MKRLLSLLLVLCLTVGCLVGCGDTAPAETTGATNRLLMGVIEDCHTVFYICVNGSTGSEIYDIANSLLEALPRSGA